MASFFLLEDQVPAAKVAYDKGEGKLSHLNLCRELLMKVPLIITLPVGLTYVGAIKLWLEVN